MKILKFSATWCAPCKAIAPIVQDVATGRNLEIQEVDVDNDPEGLVAKYHVRGVPTILILDDDETIKSKLVGKFTKPQFEQFLECLEK